MDAQSGGDTNPTMPEKASGTLGGAAHRRRIMTTNNPAGNVNSQADRYLVKWLRTGVDYYRRLAHVAADAARKQQLL